LRLGLAMLAQVSPFHLLKTFLKEHRDHGEQLLFANPQRLFQHGIECGQLPEFGRGVGQCLSDLSAQGADLQLHLALLVEVPFSVGRIATVWVVVPGGAQRLVGQDGLGQLGVGLVARRCHSCGVGLPCSHVLRGGGGLVSLKLKRGMQPDGVAGTEPQRQPFGEVLPGRVHVQECGLAEQANEL
jgi:hypothetical protein